MINLHDIRYCRLGTTSLVDSVAYAQQILGLQLVANDGKAAYFRSDSRDHTLCFFDGDPSEHTVAFEVTSPAELAAAADQLDRLDRQVRQGSAAECELRRVHSFIRFQDLTDNTIELVHRPAHSGVRYFPSRDAGITGFSHIGLCSSDPARDEAFWTSVLSAQVSDRIGHAALLRIDGVHHKIALFPAQRRGIQHINHQVESIDDLMRAYYFLREKNIKIVFGPGRHPTSGAMFLYFEGPHGMVFEYSTGVKVFTPEESAVHVPRQFPAVTSSFCQWGSKPDIAEFRNVPT
jgi:2,3-dihydroxy-p-cumate/2,3-dihydroxybenzoate 3,4-dioxygenase